MSRGGEQRRDDQRSNRGPDHKRGPDHYAIIRTLALSGIGRHWNVVGRENRSSPVKGWLQESKTSIFMTWRKVVEW